MNIEEMKKKIANRMFLDPKDLTPSCSCKDVDRNNLTDLLAQFLADNLPAMREPDGMNIRRICGTNGVEGYSAYVCWEWEDDDYYDDDEDGDDGGSYRELVLSITARSDNPRVVLNVSVNEEDEYEYNFPLSDGEVSSVVDFIEDTVI